MIIAFDYDGTFAADPATWLQCIDLLERGGHTCILVTQRGEEWEDDLRLLWGPSRPIVFADGLLKRPTARRAGWEVDVWIDDTPASVDTRAMTYIGGR